MTNDQRRVLADLTSRIGRYPKHTHPLEHATLQFNLGLALAEAHAGDRTANLRSAITAYAAALGVFKPRDFPTERSRVLAALGAAERELGMGQIASEHFEEALGLVDPVSQPAEYGSAANNLGLNLAEQGRFDEAEAVLERAVAALAGPEHLRSQLASLHNLGLAQAGRASAEGIVSAIATYQQALAKADPTEHAYLYGLLNQALALAHLSMPLDRAAHLPAAAAAAERALDVFTKRAYPFQHAVVKNNLGVSYLEREENRVSDLRRALAAFEDALRVFDPRLHGPMWREAQANLARAESKLAEAGATATRAEHFAALAGSESDGARLSLVRSRLGDVLETPDPHRANSLAVFDSALLSRPPAEIIALTGTWMKVLMERPDADLRAALQSRLDQHAQLEGEARRQAEHAFEKAIGSLEVLQRLRMRQIATEFGHSRPT